MQSNTEAVTPEIAAKRQAEYDIAPQFLNRWSPRAYSNREVDETLLLSVLEAARWAPSANNEQPWRFIVARTPDERRLFHTFINDGNRIWCEKAPVLIVIASSKTSSRGTPNRNNAFDTGAAWGYLALQALHSGLIAHAMAGFSQEKARETLRVPDDYELHAVVALGYRGDRDELPEQLQEREQPNGRRPVRESVSFGSFAE